MNRRDTTGREGAPRAGGRASPWTAVLVALVLGALATLAIGVFGLLFLGAGMLAGGLWVRRAAADQRQRALAGGVAAAGGAVLLLWLLLAAFLLPVSVTTDTGVPGAPAVEEVE